MSGQPTAPANPSPTPPPYATRFGWGMRLFLGFLLFDIIFRSFSIMLPGAEWATELEHPDPAPPPAHAAEMAEMRDKAKPEDPDPAVEDVMHAGRRLVGILPPLARPRSVAEGSLLAGRRQMDVGMADQPAGDTREPRGHQRGVAHVLAQRQPAKIRPAPGSSTTTALSASSAAGATPKTCAIIRTGTWRRSSTTS